jgi:hypothetical protein
MLVLLLALLLSGCGVTQEDGSSGLPAGEETTPPAGETVIAPAELPETEESALATQDAAVEKSGKPGPTLPAGEDAQQTPAEVITENPTTEARAGAATAVPGTAQVAPGDAMQTPSPDELATREAALERSARPGQETSPSCLGSLFLALFPALLGLFYWRSKR